VNHYLSSLLTLFFINSILLIFVLNLNGDLLLPWILIELLFGTLIYVDLYPNLIEGYIHPESKLNPDYSTQKVKVLLNPKTDQDSSLSIYINQKLIARNHLTSLDYLALKLQVHRKDKISRHLAFFPVKTETGTIWLKFYYAFSSSFFPFSRVRLITTDVEELKAYISKHNENNKLLLNHPLYDWIF
jgi:hypothetical protein